MRILLGGIFLVAATVAQAEPLKGLISRDDYPPEAMARGEQGTVVVQLRISRDGRPIGCLVTQGATRSLDAATCCVMMRRAIYKPATDDAGNPIEADVSGRVTWKLDDFKENKHNNSTRMQN